jgi:hypothetical protein
MRGERGEGRGRWDGLQKKNLLDFFGNFTDRHFNKCNPLERGEEEGRKGKNEEKPGETRREGGGGEERRRGEERNGRPQRKKKPDQFFWRLHEY